jgi:hypothetical protein
MAVFADALMCGCGYVLWGEELEDLRRDAERHVQDIHPELIDTLSPLELARPLSEDEAAA